MTRKRKLNLIEELTTHKCDYQAWPLNHAQAKQDMRRREAPVLKGPPPFLEMDPQSHAPYKASAHVPFDLYRERKPVVQTDPRECFTLKKKPKHVSTDPGQITTVLSPTLILGEVADEKDVQTLLKYTYTGLHKIYMEEAALESSKKPVPPNRVVSEGEDLRFKPNLFTPLPPGWIRAANHWDSLQSRSLGDPMKSFWTKRGPEVECTCCCNPFPNVLSKETKEGIGKLIVENNLSLPYDVTKTGYGGYRQICAEGVPLQKEKRVYRKI